MIYQKNARFVGGNSIGHVIFRVCVCVCTVCIDVKLLLIILYYIYSRGHRDLQLWPLPTKLHTGDQVSVPAVPPLGAFKTQLGGTYNILYRCCFILSLSNVILHMYIYIYNFHCRLIRFPSHLHVTGFGSWRITEMIHSCLVWFLWWLQHGAIGPSEATLFRVNVDWIDLRIYTFELVIRLSTVKLLALPFCAFDEVPRLLWSQGSQWSVLSSEAGPNCQKLLFYHCSLRFWSSTWHLRQKATGMSFSCRCGLFGFWWGQTYCAPNSLELDSRYMPLGHDSTAVSV